MNERISLSQGTEDRIVELTESLGFSSKAATIRLSISLAINSMNDEPSTFSTENANRRNSVAYSRHVIFQGDEDLYFSLIRLKERKKIPDNEIFPLIVSGYIEYGINLLYQKYRLTPNTTELKKWLLSIVR